MRKTYKTTTCDVKYCCFVDVIFRLTYTGILYVKEELDCPSLVPPVQPHADVQSVTMNFLLWCHMVETEKM